MAVKHQVSCEGCGKLADLIGYDPHVGPSEQALPKNWRRMSIIFERGLLASLLEVCSSGCAKLVANGHIDQEWESSDRGIAHHLVPSNRASQDAAGAEAERSEADVAVEAT